MSTHAYVFVETAPNTFTGTTVHFDGYPRCCGRGLQRLSWQEVRDYVRRAQETGGFRFIGVGEVETYDGDRWYGYKTVTLAAAYEQYVYVKRLDGNVDMKVGTDFDGSPIFARLQQLPEVSRQLR